MKITKNIFALEHPVLATINVYVLAIISLLIVNINKQRNKLLYKAFSISAAVDIDELKSLTSSKAHLSSKFYQVLKNSFPLSVNRTILINSMIYVE